jgi:hypothetical protein
MSPEHSVDPTDRLEQASDLPKWFASLLASSFVLLVLVVVTAILHNYSYLQLSKTGHVIWNIGAFLLIACCFTILAVILREQIREVVDRLEERVTFVKFFMLSLSLWATAGFLVFATVLVLMHITQGSLRTNRILEGLIPIQAALVLAFIGSTHRHYRAFWIGFTISLLMGSLGNDVDDQLRYFLESKQTTGLEYHQFKHASGSDYSLGQLPSSIRTDKLYNHLGINYGYRFSSLMLFAQLSTFGRAILTGLLCGGLIASFLSPLPLRENPSAQAQ